MGWLSENQFCDTQYRIVFYPSVVFFENNCPEMKIYITSEPKYSINICNEDKIVSCKIDGKI